MAEYYDYLRSRAEASVQPALDRLEEWENDPVEGATFGNPFMVNYYVLAALNVFYFAMLIFLYFFMKNREKYELKTLMKLYNLSCVCLAGATAYCAGYFAYKRWQEGTFNFACMEIDRKSETGQVMVFGAALFHIQKYWEFLDTFIFMLRKSYRQVTLLHVYHHSSITLISAMYAQVDAAGDCYLGVLLNSVVHVMMYSHYLVSSMGFSTPWKPYLTQVQLIQFVLILSQSVIAWQSGPSCGFPDFLKIIMGIYMVTMLVLFGRFYVQSYLTPKKPKSKKQ